MMPFSKNPLKSSVHIKNYKLSGGAWRNSLLHVTKFNVERNRNKDSYV
jgi:hypothetical protein